MHVRLTPVAAILATLFAHSALANEDAQQLPTVVVSANKSPLLLEHATGETVVISREEIEARKVDRLTDILNTTAGVFVASGKGPLQTAPGVALRGIPSDRRALFLVDGIAMTDGYSGSVLLGGIDPASISQAEVLFGPMSSLYGGNAMGGVVNFVTRMPTRTEFGFEAGYGSGFDRNTAPADVVKTRLHAGTRLENGLAFRISYNQSSTNGYRSEWVTATTRPAGSSGAIPTTSETGAAAFLLGAKGDNTWQEQGASIKLEQKVGHDSIWRAGWLLQQYEYNYDRPYTNVITTATKAPYYSSSFAGGESRYLRQIFHAGFETGLGIGRLNLLASRSDVQTNSYVIVTTGNAFGGAGRLNESPSSSNSLDGYWNASLGQHDLTLGYAYRTDVSDTKDFNLSDWSNPSTKTSTYSQAAGKTTLHGLYAQDNWHLAQSLTLQAGLRYDHWQNEEGRSMDPSGSATYASRTESAWSPKLGLSWRLLPELTLRTSAGRAFHAPTIYDLYRSSSLSTYNIKANPTLKPETVDTWEIGADWKPWQGGEIRTTYFHNDISDLIYLGPRVAVPGDKDMRLRINAGKATSSGVTLGISQRFNSTRLYANLTYTQSEMKENSASPSSVGKRLTNLPEKMVNIGAEQRYGNWMLALDGRYASKQYADDTNADTAANVYKAYDAYFVVDAKLNYRFNTQLDASLSVSNLLNREYFSYYAAPGRAWFASLRYNY